MLFFIKLVIFNYNNRVIYYNKKRKIYKYKIIA